MEFLTALLLIVGIDLILAGDNAIVIGLAARKLPENQQKKAVIWGTVGAVAIRLMATLVVVWLLQIPGLHLIGGLLLIWIAYKLLIDEKDHEVKAEQSLAGAVRTIVIADALMGLDNVLAVAGAAHGSYLLVALGLLISVPIIVWGSTMFIKIVERFPLAIYAGAGILAFTAAKMITNEGFLQEFTIGYPVGKWLFIGFVIVLVLFAGKRVNTRRKKQETEVEKAETTVKAN